MSALYKFGFELASIWWEKAMENFVPPTKINCDLCHGNGIVTGSFEGEIVDCPRCDGTGEVLAESNPDPYRYSS